MKDIILASSCLIVGAVTGVFLLAFGMATEEKIKKERDEWPQG